VVLTTASLFLLVVAVLLNSPALFYMSTAMMATIGASRLQAWLSVRGLRFERYAPAMVRVGELVTVDITVWSERKIRRPLVTVSDHMPGRLTCADLTPTLPVAPAYRQPVHTQYRFRPLRRGVFRWSRLTVFGTDALGLLTMPRQYEADPVEITVLPAPVPIPFELPTSAGWGFAETEHGKARGLGIQPRSIREYQSGDALKYVHWPSTARHQRMMVKEFETGSHAAVAFFLQTTRGSEIGEGADTTLELMCSHAAYLTSWLLRQGVDVTFPENQDGLRTGLAFEREQAALRFLAGIQADSEQSLADRLRRCKPLLEPGGSVCVFVAVAEQDLPDALTDLARSGHPVNVIAYDADKFAARQGSGAKLSLLNTRVSLRGSRLGGRLPRQHISAAERGNMEALRNTGARVQSASLEDGAP